MSIDEQQVEAGRSPAAETVDGFAIPEGEPSGPPIPAPAPKALPVEGAERVTSVDVIRGVALMGILAMNIVGFAWPGNVYSIPTQAPDHDWADLALWGLNHMIFDTKMMTLFSMLFGAGLVLMSDRAEGRGARLRGIYYRRIFWLLVIGLVHSYLIWDGDVLVLYALTGLLLYPARKWSARTLIVAGVAVSLLIVPLWAGFRWGVVPFMKATADRVVAEAKANPGRKPAWWEDKVREGWVEMSKKELPKREDFLTDIRTYRGGYLGIVADRAEGLIWGQTLGFIFGGWMFAGGRMLIGMGLMRLGVFAAARSRRTYLNMMIAGYAIGLPIVAYDLVHSVTHNFDQGRGIEPTLEGWPFLSIYGNLPVVIGHIGAIMLILQAGALPWLTRRLGAAGRMALSNYLFDSLFCTTLFYGYGLDFFAALHRPLLYAIVVTIWVAQLLVCPLWLQHFRYGPAEWLWRSLTYWKLQPIRAKLA